MGYMIKGFHGGNCMILHMFSLWKGTVMRRLTTGIRSKKCVVRRFRHCANILECTYTNLYSIALLVGRSRDRFPVVSLGIFYVATDRTMCPGVDSASKNGYQGISPGVKAAGA
jgi:hypothetical protein